MKKEAAIEPAKITLSKQGDYQRLFSVKQGNAFLFRSGQVILPPGEEVGVHNTESSEEIIIALRGKGRLLIYGDEQKKEAERLILFEMHETLYVPPDKVHNVVNRGKEILRYIFITSPVSRAASRIRSHGHER